MTTKPPSPAEARRQRQARARWAFYGRLGSLRLCDGVLRAIHAEFTQSADGRCTIDGILAEELSRAIIGIGYIRKALLAHKDDWKRTP